jgi:hypothetical protein
MHELFVSTDLITVDLNYKIIKLKSGLIKIEIIKDEDLEKLQSDPVKSKNIKTIKTKWKIENWKEANTLLQKALKYNHVTDKNDFDNLLFAELKVKTLLVQWDLKDENDKPIPCEEKNIFQLHPTIISGLLDKYTDILNESPEDQEKN